MARKQSDLITSAITAKFKRKIREAKYKMMDDIDPNLRLMLRMQRAMKTLSRTQAKLSKSQ